LPTGLVEFENTARRNINENRSLIQALRDNLRIGGATQDEEQIGSRISSPKKSFAEMGALRSKGYFLLGADFNRNLVMS
jgi:hypothetical protein